MTAADLHRTILAVWRIEQPRLITSLSRMLRDVPLAEDLTQEALLAALEHWPVTGVPEKPGAWLMATAKRRALDHLRRGKMLARKHDMLARDLEQEQQAMPDPDAALDDEFGDELLRLIFTACHPLLSREARAALALQHDLRPDDGGDRARLPDAGGDRRPAHRARRSGRCRNPVLPTRRRAARSCPSGSLRCSRSSTSSSTKATPPRAARSGCGRSSATRRCGMGRVLTSIAPQEPEAHGLLALMELNASRARRAPTRRRSHPADGPEPRAVGPAADPPRPAGAGAGARTRRRRRLLCAAGRDRRLPRQSEHTGRNRLAAHRPSSTPSLRPWCARRSSNSTARWPSAWPRARRRRWQSWRRWRTSRR